MFPVMPKALTDISQAQYNQLGNKYLRILQGDLFFFYDRADKTIVKVLEAKLDAVGYTIQSRNSPGDVLVYTIEKPKGISVVAIDLCSAVKSILCVDDGPNKIPDFKIVVDEYLAEKVIELVEKFFPKLQNLLNFNNSLKVDL